MYLLHGSVARGKKKKPDIMNIQAKGTAVCIVLLMKWQPVKLIMHLYMYVHVLFNLDYPDSFILPITFHPDYSVSCSRIGVWVNHKMNTGIYSCATHTLYMYSVHVNQNTIEGSSRLAKNNRMPDFTDVAI